MLTRARIRENLATVIQRTPLDRMSGSEQGFAMVLTLSIVIIFSLVGLAMMTMALYQAKDADRTKPSNRAFDLAQCGLSYGRGYLVQDNIPPDGTPPSGGYSSGTIQMGSSNSTFSTYVWKDPSPPFYNIRSTGTYRALEGSEYRDYTRTLEERVRYSGAEGHFDCFNYVMFSKNGDINMDAGWLAANYTNMRIEGNMYANNVTLRNIKAVLAGGTLNVNGEVYAVSDATLYAYTGVAAYSGVSVNGNLTTGSNAKVWGKTAALAGADAYVKNDVNAGGSATVLSEVGALAGAGAKVGGDVNAAGDILVRGYAAAAAGSTARVSGDAYAGGTVTMEAQDFAITGTRAKVGGDVKACGQANISSVSSTWSGLEANVDGKVKCNSSSTLKADCIWFFGIDLAEVNIGDWHRSTGTVQEYGGGKVNKGATYGNPGLSAPTVETVPDVDLPNPDWSWYRTMAISQGSSHYNNGLPPNSGPYTNVQIVAQSQYGSGDVFYYDDDVTFTQILINPARKGVIVCDGDVNVTNILQTNAGSEYQIICTGDITFDTNLTLNINANDTIFFYTNGTHNHGGTQRTGKVKYNLGWFRDLYGQITCTGNIETPSAGPSNTPIIKYKAPSVPVEAWPIPMQILRFREL